MLKLNETPVRTSRNFNINNIKLDDINIPDSIGNFENITIVNESSNIKIDNNVNNTNLTYGLGTILEKQVKENANQKLNILVDGKTNKELIVDFEFDEDNINLVDNIQVVANENSKATIIIKYQSLENIQAFHNGILKVIAKKNAHINIILLNLLNLKSYNFISVENELKQNAKVNYTIIDFGGKNSITNYYSNLLENNADNKINTIYLGKENQLFDFNYIGELRGEKANINIEVQGAIKDNANKHFKGTIDFKKGCKKAMGDESEFCMLLSDTAKSISLPMLLCSEEDVEGNHSSSAGKIGEKELFYIMSRGFELKEAMKLIVRAMFNKVLENIENKELQKQILKEINIRLD